MRLQNTEVMLVDLAGLDRPAAALDEQVQRTVQHELQRADLILHVHDPTKPEEAGIDLPPRTPTLDVVTKADLPPPATASSTAAATGPGRGCRGSREIRVSGTTGTGFAELRQAIRDRLTAAATSATGSTLALNPRHIAALTDAIDALQATPAEPDEFAAATLRRALDALASLGGELTPDAILGRVFATFCVGK